MTQAWRMAALAACYFGFQFIHINLLNAIASDLVATFHWTPATLALMGSLFFLPVVILAIPAGVVLDHYPAKWVIVATLFLSIAGSISMAWAPHTGWFGLGRLCTGIAHGFCFLACMRFAYQWIPPAQWAAVSGWVAAIGLLGGMLAQTPLNTLRDIYGWRLVITGVAGLGACLWAVLAVCLRHPPDCARPYAAGFPPEHQAHGTTLCVWTHPQIWLASVVGMGLNIPVLVMGALWGGLYLTQGLGMRHTEAAWACSLIFLGALLASPLIGWISDRWQCRKPVLIATQGCMLGLTGLLITLSHAHPWAIYTIFGLMGCLSAGSVITYAVCAEMVPSHLTGKALSLNTMVIMGGSMLLQNLFGQLLGSLNTPDFHRAWYAMLWVSGISWAAAWALQESYPRSLIPSPASRT